VFAGISQERFLECASLRHEEELDLRRLIVWMISSSDKSCWIRD
jgi:hypothetical protein